MITTSTQYDNDEVTVCAAEGIYFTHDDILLALILWFAFSWFVWNFIIHDERNTSGGKFIHTSWYLP